MSAEPIFDIDVNVSKEMNENYYETVIKKLRPKLAVTWTHNRPVLRRLIPDPDKTTGFDAFRKAVQWWDIVLKLNEKNKPQQVVRLRLRDDNLYLYGYQVNNVWFELRIAKDKEDNTWCIDKDSIALGYDHNYNSIEQAGGVKMNSLKLGREELVSAVKALAEQGTKPARAQALIKLIFMFAEASRFEEVLAHVKKGFLGKSTPKIEDWTLRQVRKWGDLSDAVLYHDQFPGTKWTIQTVDTETGKVMLYSVEDVLKYVALLRRDPLTIPPTITITIKANL